MNASGPENAGIRFPPPFIYLAGFLISWELQRLSPLPIASGEEPRWMRILAWALVAIWALLAASAVSLFRKHRTSFIPHQPASALVTTGIYRFTRNPMYLSLASLTLAGAIFLDSWWVVITLPGVLTIVDRLVISREERYLAARFGAEYDDYRGNVRRWL